MKTLQLTSPETRGTAVRNAQLLLKEHGYYTDEVDGVYGVMTAQAVYRAKYWIGYANRNLNQIYGDSLKNLLLGKTKPNLAMKARRKLRLRNAAKEPLRLKAYKEAEKWIGTKENPPKSNIAKPFTTWYGWIGWGAPWCAVFCSYVYSKAGSKAVKAGKYWAYCPYIVSDARAGRNNLTVTKNPQKGDWVMFDWDNDGISDHIGIFNSWQDGGRAVFSTIEGNTSYSDNSNGGEVMRRERRIADVVIFVRVGK